MLSPLYMAEISPPEVRGSLLALEQFSIVLGVVLGFWLGFFTRNSECIALPSRLLLITLPVSGSASWRLPLGFQIIPGFILLFGCLFLPASPRLLVMKGQYDKARSTLAKLRMRAESDALIQVHYLSFFFRDKA